MKVIGYSRVSTNEQAENGVSLKAQEQRVREYCRAQGWQLVEVVRDDGYSAKDLKRPELSRLLEEFPEKHCRFQGIVVEKLDRLTRSVRDLIRLTELLLKHGIALGSIQEAVDTTTATGKMFYSLVTVISEWERGVIGERTREALAYKRRNGERIGPVPYGYIPGRDGKHLTLDPIEGPVVARMMRERKRGVSLGRIADGLNADRITTKGGKTWYPATVKSVLETAGKWAGVSLVSPLCPSEPRTASRRTRARRAA
jgi:site-specific DNA recombinase